MLLQAKEKNGLNYAVLDVTYHFRIQHSEKDVIYFLITQWNQRCYCLPRVFSIKD